MLNSPGAPAGLKPPWTHFGVGRPRTPATPPPPPPPPPPPIVVPLPFVVPVALARRFPWLRVRHPFGTGFSNPPLPPSPPPSPPPLSHAGTNKPFVPRVPDPQAEDSLRRMARHTERVADVLNSLMLSGQLYEVTPVPPERRGQWVVVVAPGQIEGSGVTGVFNSGTFGNG